MSGPGYFPYRAYKNRPYNSAFLKLPNQERKWDVLTMMALSQTRNSFGDRETINSNPKLSEMVHSCCMHESWLATALADFFDGGQVVFHIENELKEAFATSDLGDATANDLKFPFNNLYVHIGYASGLFFNGGRAQCEGVLLSEKLYKNEKTLSVTMVGELVEKPAHWGLRGMETFTFHFSEAQMSLPILDACRQHLESHSKEPNTDDPEFSEFDEATKTEIRESHASRSGERRITRENIPTALECVRMVANALLYISHYPDDMVDGYQEGFPAGFREKLEHSEGKAYERILSKARSSGFTLIKRVGSIFSHALLVEASVSGSPAPHLRRAHWRRQAFGVGLSLRKLIWVRAARVLGGVVRDRPYLVAKGITQD